MEQHCAICGTGVLFRGASFGQSRGVGLSLMMDNRRNMSLKRMGFCTNNSGYEPVATVYLFRASRFLADSRVTSGTDQPVLPNTERFSNNFLHYLYGSAWRLTWQGLYVYSTSYATNDSQFLDLASFSFHPTEFPFFFYYIFVRTIDFSSIHVTIFLSCSKRTFIRIYGRLCVSKNWSLLERDAGSLGGYFPQIWRITVPSPACSSSPNYLFLLACLTLKMRAQQSFEISVTPGPTTQRHIAEFTNLYHNFCESIQCLLYLQVSFVFQV